MDDLVSTRPSAAVRLIHNWREVLARAWSVRFIALAIFFSAVEILLPFFMDRFAPGVFAALSVTAMIAALVSRVILQKKTGAGL